MQAFKLFIIRLLQVSWLLNILAAIGTLFGDAQAVPFFIMPVLFLIAMQYLILSNYNPYDLFNGRLTDQVKK